VLEAEQHQLTPGRIGGLRLALNDLAGHRILADGREGPVVVAAGRDVAAVLGEVGMVRFVPLEVAEHADACVLIGPVRLDSPEAILGWLAKVPADGAVLATFDLAGFSSHHREVVTRELAERFPELACRVCDMGSAARDEGLSPWVLVRRRRPRCWLFLGESGSGKTSAVIDFGLRTGLRTYHGDLLLQRIALGEWPAEPDLKACAVNGHTRFDWSVAIRRMMRKDLFGGLANSILADVAGADFCFEMAVQPEFRAQIIRHFEERGYHPFAPGA
jgi:hypothetical protein